MPRSAGARDMTGDAQLFETPRLAVRRLSAADVDAMHAVYGDAGAMRWVGDGEPLPREGCVEWVAVTHRNYATRGYGMSALVLRETGEVIGFCGIVHPGGQPAAEIKYALRRAHWGRGLASEAVAGMLAWGATTHGIAEIIATTAPDNAASQRVLAKAGMRPAGSRDNDDGTLTLIFAWHAPGASHAGEPGMPIETFMQGYKAAWEGRDDARFCRLFTADGAYHNTPFAVQRGHAELAAYWQRVKLQEDVRLSYEVLAATPTGGVAHWHVTYQVASEALFAIWAASTGTNLLARKPGDPLPRLTLDGVLQAEFDASGLCRECRLWWHSMAHG